MVWVTRRGGGLEADGTGTQGQEEVQAHSSFLISWTLVHVIIQVSSPEVPLELVGEIEMTERMINGHLCLPICLSFSLFHTHQADM